MAAKRNASSRRPALRQDKKVSVTLKAKSFELKVEGAQVLTQEDLLKALAVAVQEVEDAKYPTLMQKLFLL